MSKIDLKPCPFCGVRQKSEQRIMNLKRRMCRLIAMSDALNVLHKQMSFLTKTQTGQAQIQWNRQLMHGTGEQTMSRMIDADKFECVVLPKGSSDEFCDGAKWILEKIDTAPTVNQWIPCSERLPDQQEAVLIQDFDYITIGYLNGENHWRDLTNIDGYLKVVVAWMPLPEPFKEVTE